MQPPQFAQIPDHFPHSVRYRNAGPQLVAIACVDDIGARVVAEDEDELSDYIAFLNVFLETASIAGYLDVLQRLRLSFGLGVGAGEVGDSIEIGDSRFGHGVAELAAGFSLSGEDVGHT